VKPEIVFQHLLPLQILLAEVVLQIGICRRIPHIVINAVDDAVKFLGQLSESGVQTVSSLHN